MAIQQQSSTDIKEHLEIALEAAESHETKFQLREALQKLQSYDSAEFSSAASLDN